LADSPIPPISPPTPKTYKSSIKSLMWLTLNVFSKWNLTYVFLLVFTKIRIVYGIKK
jgi:hypothetical protein